MSSSNPYAMESFPGFEVASAAPVDARVSFIRKTYLHVLGAVLAFIGLESLMVAFVPVESVANLFLGTPLSALLVFGAFMLMSYIGQSMANNRANPGVAYAGLGIYVAAYTLFFFPLIAIAWKFFGPELVIGSAGATALIFGGLTATVFVTKKDFSFMRGALMIGSFAALAAILVGMFTGWSSAFELVFVVAMIVLAGGYVLYDTSNVLHKYAVDQHVPAAVALFGSLALLFYYVLRLAMIIAASRD